VFTGGAMAANGASGPAHTGRHPPGSQRESARGWSRIRGGITTWSSAQYPHHHEERHEGQALKPVRKTFAGGPPEYRGNRRQFISPLDKSFDWVNT